MRFKKQIWEYFIRFSDEKRLIDYKKSKGREEVLPFYDMNEEKFNRMFNTLCWLVKFNSYTIRFSFEIKLMKPTNEDIMEVLNYIENEANELFNFSKSFYADKEIRRDLRKKAKKELACIEYYRELINQDYFKDKELRNYRVVDLSTEGEIEIPNKK